jgi:hypothetical protein
MEALEVPANLRELAPQSDCALLDWLRDRVSRLMIEEISKNDYGRCPLENFAAVELQLRADPSLGFLQYVPREVLELERWNEPELDEPPSGQQGHVKRLLACTILLRNVACTAATEEPQEFFVETSAASLIQLTRSAIVLDGEVPHLAIRFLLWVYGTHSHPAFRPFAAFSVLLLTAYIGPERLPGLNFSDVCAWVLAVEAHCREMLGWRVESERWLVGLSSYEDDKRRRTWWEDTARHILTRPNKLLPIQAQNLLRDLSDRVGESRPGQLPEDHGRKTG